MADTVFLLGVESPRQRQRLVTKDDIITTDPPTKRGSLQNVVFNQNIRPYNITGTGSTPLNDPRRKGVLLVDTVDNEDADDFSGSFISGRVSKLGGTSGDNTTVFLYLDDKLVVNMNFGKARLLNLKDGNNPYGIMLHRSSDTPRVLTLTFGFGVPLHFSKSLKLFVRVQEAKVPKIESAILFGKTGGGGGGDGTGSGEEGEGDFP